MQFCNISAFYQVRLIPLISDFWHLTYFYFCCKLVHKKGMMTMSMQNTFLIPKMTEQIGQTIQYDPTASWKDAEVCFNITNYAYPTTHTHDYYEICVIFSGSMVHNINGISYVMQRGDCCLIRAEDSHFFTDDPSQTQRNCLSANFMCRRDFIENTLKAFGPDCLSMLLAIKQPLSFKVSNTVTSKIEKTCLYIQSPGEHPTDSNLMICKSVILELLSACVLHQCTQIHDDFPNWLDILVRSLQNPDNFDKKIPELIKDISYSYSYIQKQFRHYMGATIVSYWSSIKLSHAKELLTNSNMSVLEISTRLGYETASHLNHLFKKHFGVSPSSIRK